VKISEKWAVKLKNGWWVPETVIDGSRYKRGLENGGRKSLNGKELTKSGRKW